tara:strand:+ start:4848 stop:5042 length:195 start_codon:yes stop_codon:yes gene_type:complete
MIGKEVLMESLRQRETELHELQDEVERLRGDFKGLGKSLKQQLPHCKDKEMIEWIIEQIQEKIK